MGIRMYYLLGSERFSIVFMVMALVFIIDIIVDGRLTNNHQIIIYFSSFCFFGYSVIVCMFNSKENTPCDRWNLGHY